MAGDWIKMEASTPEKEEVLAITARMGWDDPDLTVGKLFRLWRWFDQQTLDGNAARVTSALLNRQLGVSGFCEALQEVGWLAIDKGGLTLPKFDRHNGNTAKRRALTAKRVAKHKGKTANAQIVSAPLPREEKRRDIQTPTVSVARKVPKGSKRCPDSFAVTAEMVGWAKANAPGVDVPRETVKLRNHEFAKPRSDWPATWQNWILEASDRLRSRGTSADAGDSGYGYETPADRAKRERMHEPRAGSLPANRPRQRPHRRRSMSLPASWVDSLFARMAVRYGEKFGRNYAGMDLNAVKADWAEVLDGMTPKAISYCLTNLPIDWPPNAMQFRAAWINAHDDRPTHYLLPPPKPDPERVKAAFERLGKIAAGRSPTQWIHDLETREAAGEHLSLTQRKYLAQARKNLGWGAAA